MTSCRKRFFALNILRRDKLLFKLLLARSWSDSDNHLLLRASSAVIRCSGFRVNILVHNSRGLNRRVQRLGKLPLVPNQVRPKCDEYPSIYPTALPLLRFFNPIRHERKGIGASARRTLLLLGVRPCRSVDHFGDTVTEMPNACSCDARMGGVTIPQDPEGNITAAPRGVNTP